MGNLMTSMYTGVSGLTVSQSALNTTAHNLANAGTQGFVRQQVLIADASYIKVGESYNSYMQVGLGTSMEAIRQVRDSFLDKLYRLEIGRQGFYEAQYHAVEEVESLFGELEGETYQETISKLWTSIEELAKEPDDVAKRATLIQTAESFLERSENIAGQLNKYQLNLNKQISDKVGRINQIGDQIRELNTKIRQYESNGQAANDYRDTRNSLMDELGQLAKYTYKENASGIVTINLEGVQFVTEDTVYHMGTATISDATKMLKPIWIGNGGTDVYNLDTAYSTENNTDIGSLKGVLVARGGYIANYTDIPVSEDYAGGTSDPAYRKAVSEYANKIEPSVIMTVQAQFDQLVHGITTITNDILSPNTTVSDYMKHMGIGTTADISTIVKADGTPADIGGILLWDEANAPVGMDENSTGREALFDRKSMERYTKATMTMSDGTKYDVYIYNEEDPSDNYSLFTIGEIEVNENIKKNYSLLPLNGNAASGQSGAYDIKTCEKLITSWETAFATLDPNTLTKSDFGDYYIAMIGDIASRGDVNNTIATKQASMVESINNKRQEVAGVSSDEELTNLIKYQHAYNAAARYINVIDQLLEHIVTRL